MAPGEARCCQGSGVSVVRARPQGEQREQQLVGASRGVFADPRGTIDSMGQSKPNWELESKMMWGSEVKCAVPGQNLGDRCSKAAVQILVRGQRQANGHVCRRGPPQRPPCQKAYLIVPATLPTKR